MTNFESDMKGFQEAIDAIETMRDELNMLAAEAKLALETIKELKKERDELMKDIIDTAEKKIDCVIAKCENCTNHNYCDYEQQESEDKA